MTVAELVKFRFEHATKTISIPVLAAEYGFDREKWGGAYIYTFPDQSRLIVRGRGRSHSIRTEP